MRPHKIFLVAIHFLISAALIFTPASAIKPAHPSAKFTNSVLADSGPNPAQIAAAGTEQISAAGAKQVAAADKAAEKAEPTATNSQAMPENASARKTVYTGNAKVTYDTKPVYFTGQEIQAYAIADNPACAGSFNSQFLCLINNYRASQSKPALAIDPALNKIAQNYSAQMQSTGNFSHIGAGGATFVDRCRVAGTTCWAENLAMGFTSAQNLFEMWKNSPTHNANMLGNYHQIGIGTAGVYATTLFR